MSDLITDMMHQATHDAALFRTYADDYDIVDDDQVMRCLANLDDAIGIINHLTDFRALPNSKQVKVDAIFTALRIMQDNLKAGVEHESEKVLESKREMAAIGGDRG